jgi:hypothetical protein
MDRVMTYWALLFVVTLILPPPAQLTSSCMGEP